MDATERVVGIDGVLLAEGPTVMKAPFVANRAEENFGQEGLGQDAFGAQFRGELKEVEGASLHGDDVEVGARAPNLDDGLDAFFPGHYNVENYDMGRVCAVQHQAFAAISRHRDLEASLTRIARAVSHTWSPSSITKMR